MPLKRPNQFYFLGVPATLKMSSRGRRTAKVENRCYKRCAAELGTMEQIPHVVGDIAKSRHTRNHASSRPRTPFKGCNRIMYKHILLTYLYIFTIHKVY